jgi:putative transposase
LPSPATAPSTIIRAKARRLVARAHARVANARADYLHKLSRRLVDENQVIAVEDLNVKGMM